MFRAIGRYFRALGYLLVGKVDRARQAISANPDVVRATYDNVIEEKKKRIHQYKEAVAGMIAQEEKKRSTLRQLTDEITRLQKLRDGAAAMARKVVDRHGKDVEAVKSDPEYLRCQAAFKDFSSSLQEKQDRCDEIDGDLKTLVNNVTGHKNQLQSLLRDLEKLKQEQLSTVAEIITAKEEREVAELIAGISKDRTSEELQELRNIRDQAKAESRVSREMSGIDAKRSEDEFMEYASKNVADSEFDALIGLAESAESSTTETPDKARIPEA
jgi:hypothetical protein